MCGIAGFTGVKDDASSRRLETMTASLAHRGPDGQGLWSDGVMNLGHRRLAILDLGAGGYQPMASPSRRVVVFNGEIYNHLDLRQQLTSLGFTFKTRSDTETLLAAWDHWGPACLEHLVGMFAFALWDPGCGRLFMARDRLGKKPLYLWRQGKFLAFASEAKALLSLPEVHTQAGLDVRAMADFLCFGYVLGEKSAWSGISRLPPAHWAQFDVRTGDFQQTCYWQLERHVLAERIPYDEAARHRFGELLDDAVAIRLQADVPVGCFLSGGVDSSAIAATAARIAGQKPLTFSVSFPQQSFDESAYAQQVADYLGLTLHRLDGGIIGAGAVAHGLDASDEFFADTSLMPTWLLNQSAARQVKVALSGDGADEILAGYPTYAADRLYGWYARIPGPVQAGLAYLADRLLRPSYGKVSFDYKLRRFFSGRGQSRQRAHAWWRVVFEPGTLPSMLTDSVLESLGDYDPLAEFDHHFRAVEGADFLDQCLYVDIKTWLADDILVKADRMSMAHGLEVRSPFLDHRLVEFCARLEPCGKMQGTRQKVILKDVMAGRLPTNILSRRKQGFGAPTAGVGAEALPTLDFPDLFRQGFLLDGRREDITYKSFALAVLSQWMLRWSQ